MKIHILQYGIYILILFLFSCSGSDGIEKDRIGLKKYLLKRGNDKLFLLDSMTTQETNYMQLINEVALAIYNQPGNTICVFDLKTGKEVKKIQLYKDGPNMVKGIQGFYYQSDDSIWLYRNWQKDLLLVDSEGVVKDKKNLKEKLLSEQTKYTVSPYPLTDLPFLKDGNKFIFQGMNGPGTENGLLPATTIFYDISTNEIEVKNTYPTLYGEQYINERWEAFSYRIVPYTLNDNKEMVLSFPADDSISVYNVTKDSYKRFFAGYSSETNIFPLSKGASKTELQRNYLEQYQYASIFYDPYHELYYRFVILPIFDYDLKDESTQYKPMSIIILDSSFAKVGEVDLDKEYYKYRNAFVSAEGLHINIHSDDDDYLNFITLNLIKNEK